MMCVGSCWWRCHRDSNRFLFFAFFWHHVPTPLLYTQKKDDYTTAYEAIRISSGNSFVHETESQVILNGSRDINFTMDLVVKDISLFQEIADRESVPLEISPLLIEIFRDAQTRYGPREWSPNVIRRLEDSTGLDIRAPGFPAEIVDHEAERLGEEVVVSRD